MAGIFDTTFTNIIQARENRECGIVNNIPFGLPTLDKHLPGIMKGLQYLITANSGVGKTQLAKFLFVNQAYKFIKENPQHGIKIKILYFALEESKEEFMRGLICNRLKDKYNLNVTSMELMGINHTLSQEIVDKINESAGYFHELEECLDVIENTSNPFGIYKYVREYAESHGTDHMKEQVFVKKDKEGNILSSTKEMVYSHYEPNDPKEIVIVVADHISLLQSEGGGTLHDAMTKMSAEYGRKHITKRYGYCMALVQQQASDVEKQQYTTGGTSIEAKVEPSLAGLGDNKLTQRDAFIVLALFAPERHCIDKHMGYDIKILKDFYRCLIVLKNRMGVPNQRLALLFNGASNTFAELPKPGSPELEGLYEQIKEFRRRGNVQ